MHTFLEEVLETQVRPLRKPESWIWADGGSGGGTGTLMVTAHQLPKAPASSFYQVHAPSLVLLAEFIPLCLYACSLGVQSAWVCSLHNTGCCAPRQCLLLFQVRKPLTCSGMGRAVDTVLEVGQGPGSRK